MSNYIVGLTGGIGSGKTTVANIFITLGIEVIDADIIAREVVQPNSEALKAIAKHFGNEYINSNGELNRALLRTRIFQNVNDKEWLNALLHPLINRQIKTKITLAKSFYCILVAPLLIENKLVNLVDRVLVIDVSEDTQLLRTLQRDTSTLSEIKSIIASQISRKERLNSAHDIIENNKLTLLEIRILVTKLHEQYLLLAQ